ncbi:hypothetical protein [Luteolibacter marinus]|uniref:hypothetical protein n=1 Tax=Luteolibacter marinus TaxID=2776705 RepID=UPI001868FBD1|nr:hypothetical protein [Luteolibacter marinus]
MRISPLLAVLFTFCGDALQAQMINIDFSAPDDPYVFTGLAAVPDPAGEAALWNQLPASTGGLVSFFGLVDSYGNPTPVSIQLAINGYYSDPAGQQEMGGPGAPLEGMMADYVYLSAPTNTQVVSKTGTIGGLVSGNAYDIYFYSQGNTFSGPYSAGQNGLFNVGGEIKQSSWDGTAGGDGLLVDGVEYVKFSAVADDRGAVEFSWANVVAGPDGNVAVDLDGQSSRFAVINGIQIVDATAAVPELSAGLLGLLGGMMLFSRRRSAGKTRDAGPGA